MITPPRVANNGDTEINKALIDLAKLVSEADEALAVDYIARDAVVAATVTALSTRVTRAEGEIVKLSKGYKIGGALKYAGANDTHTLEPMVISVSFGGVEYLVEVPQTTITNAYANYPGAGAWAVVTCDYHGVIQLQAAAGAGTVRPADNFYARTGGGVGYENLALYGYYFAAGERIIGAIYRLNATNFRYIENGVAMDEEGSHLSTIGGSGTFGAQTYTIQMGFWRRETRQTRATFWGSVGISAKGAGIAGNVLLPTPFASRTPLGGTAISAPGSVGYAAGFTYPAGTTYLILGVGAGSSATLYGNGSAVAGTVFPVGSMAAASQLSYFIQTTF